jgi:hypothetical protein
MKEIQPQQLGMCLVEADLITPEELKIALNEQKAIGKPFAEILVMLGFVKQQTIEYFIENILLSKQHQIQTQTSNNTDVALSEQANSTQINAMFAKPRSHQLQAYLYPKGTAKFLLKIVVFLTIANLITSLCQLYLPDYPSRDFLKMIFNLDGETNVPSSYSALVILFCSVLMAIIAQTQKLAGNQNFRSWIGLSVVFAYLSIDEFMSIHELLIEPLRNALNTRGVLYYAWVIAGAAFVLIFLILFGKFIFTLPVKTRNLFFLAGTIYVMGALGCELVSGYYADYYNSTDIIFVLMTTVEEVLEMLGMIIFTYALLSYISNHMKGVDVGFHILAPRKQQLSS